MAVDFEIKDRYDINDFIKLVTVLRAPGGCPWDREQTHESIKKNLIEETYEVIEAINKKSSGALLEELGDLLLQIGLHSEMEREKGNFDFDDVVDEICQKLVIRHPHVFGNVVAQNAKEALNSWDEIKKQTKGIKNQSESMVSVPRELPALMRAQKVQQRAAKAGFDWADAQGVFEKLLEEIGELKSALSGGGRAEIEDEFGDLLFTCVNLSRFLNLDCEEALTGATDKFLKRYITVEELAGEAGLELKTASPSELDALWGKAKILNA
ncbi:MAG: nucleoside triphosphate pyrophosphohydrolase [Clostridiales bacterium]|nr:nucleoside triphosphate pyrophosphohydrolase [Clostridiales bacterium]